MFMHMLKKLSKHQFDGTHCGGLQVPLIQTEILPFLLQAPSLAFCEGTTCFCLAVFLATAQSKEGTYHIFIPEAESLNRIANVSILIETVEPIAFLWTIPCVCALHKAEAGNRNQETSEKSLHSFKCSLWNDMLVLIQVLEIRTRRADIYQSSFEPTSSGAAKIPALFICLYYTAA